MGSNITDGIRPLAADEVKLAYILEEESYPEDEAASLESLQFRQREAPDLSLGLFEGRQLIAFICGTRYLGPRFRAESMTAHDPCAPCVCVHSVCVRKDRRRQGLAVLLLDAYHEHVRLTQRNAIKMMLLCKSYLIPLYTRAGYGLICRSPIVHGRDNWYEMEQFV